MDETWLSQKEVAELENITERAVRKRFQQGHFKTFHYVESRRGGGRGGKKLEIALESLSLEAQSRYYKRLGEGENPSSEIPPGEFDNFDRQPQWKKDEALRWLKIIEAFEAYAKKGRAVKDFIALWRIDHPTDKAFSRKTLLRKINQFRNSGLDGLINRRDPRHYKSWPEEAKAFLFQKYCNPNQPTASWCIAHLRSTAREKGWRLPSSATLRRFLERIPRDRRDYHRKGEKYWREHYIPSVLRDYEKMVPGELYVGDHAQINVAVRHPSGRVLFPWITAWEDMRSRKILGWVLADIPSANTINLALKHTIERYGAPEHVVIDNGRDFSAKHFTGRQSRRFRFKINENEMTGIYKLLDVEPHFCIPANARAKNIERWFWTQEQNFQKAFPTYRGNSVVNRPEGVDKRIESSKLKAESAKLKAQNSKSYVLEWEEFTDCLKNYIETYNQDHKHQGQGMNARTPNQVWNEYFAAHAQRRVSPTSLSLLMMRSAPTKVGRFGITAFGERYRSSELMDHQGKEVVYRYDPENLSIFRIYSLEGQYICMAERTHRTAWNDEEAYHQIKKLEKKQKRAIQAEREAAENLVEVEFGHKETEPTGDHPDKPPKVVRILRTPLDGAEKQIESAGTRMQDNSSRVDFGEYLNDLARQRREEEAEREKRQQEFADQFNEVTRRRLQERKHKEAKNPRLFKLTIPGGEVT